MGSLEESPRKLFQSPAVEVAKKKKTVAEGNASIQTTLTTSIDRKMKLDQVEIRINTIESDQETQQPRNAQRRGWKEYSFSNTMY